MTEIADWVLVRVAPDERVAESWTFALHALGIEHRVDPPGERQAGWGVWVEPTAAARAIATLNAHDREAREESERALREGQIPDHGQSLAGVAAAVALVAFFAVTGPREADAGGWFRAGSAVADHIVRGQWWRAVTALTLHADIAHVLGNAAAAIIFISPLGRWLGDGLALLLVAAAGTSGNLATAYLYGAHHDSVGASTATFAALGLLGGLQIVRRLRGQPDPRGGLRRAFVVLAACLGLFAMLGVGPRTDVVAHLTGLGAGLVFGCGAGVAVRRQVPWVVQVGLLAFSAFAVVACWSLALR